VRESERKQREDPAGVGTLVRAFAADRRFGAQLSHRRYLPPVAARHRDIELHPRLREVLRRDGIEQLWAHQVQAIERVRRGEHVVVMTPTASGKSLVYNVPVLEAILARPEATALYVFPLKGLEQDQVGNLQRLLDALGIRPARTPHEREPLAAAEVYDGDTPPSRRRKIRERPPNVVFTTPDMLHLAINPYHAKWAAFLRRLEYVVIDEVHSYRGVFGSHAAQVFRRLRRICRHYGAEPRFVACSATIANPGQLAARLTGLSFAEVTESGAPRGGRHFVLVNPATGSPYTEATRLFLRCLAAGLKSIVFTKARRVTELIYQAAVERAGPAAARVRPYRAGFLASERREIERGLFRGEILGVVSTSALELGVDIGGLDCCILVGYPGSVASTWQRAGRAGRRGRDSAVFLVALRDALDQYFMRHPDAFFAKSVEAVALDPHNPHLLRQHLPCAASELYLRGDDAVYDVPSLRPLLDELTAAGELAPGRRSDIWFARRRQPQRAVGIRSIGEPVGVVLRPGARKIGELSGARAFREAFPGAIYLHYGRQYRITHLDVEARRAYCREVDVDYYTQPLSDEETRVRAETASARRDTFSAHRGEVEMRWQVTGYDKRRLFGGERIGRRTLTGMPQSRFDTQGLWLRPDPGTERSLTRAGHDLAGSLHAVEHAAIKCIPLFGVCDPGDVGGLSYPHYPPFRGPAVFIYDGHPGGIGFTRRAFEVLDRWLLATLALVRECPCGEAAGCPACVQDGQCGSGNEPLDKAGAVALLRRWTGTRGVRAAR